MTEKRMRLDLDAFMALPEAHRKKLLALVDEVITAHWHSGKLDEMLAQTLDLQACCILALTDEGALMMTATSRADLPNSDAARIDHLFDEVREVCTKLAGSQPRPMKNPEMIANARTVVAL